MHESMRRMGMAAAGIVVALLWSVNGLAAQVAPGDARAFLGEWDVTIEADTPFTFRMNIQEESGRVVAAVTAPDGTTATVRDVARTGEDLVFRYTADVQGQQIPIAISLKPDGDHLRGALTVADGLFAAPARATRS